MSLHCSLLVHNIIEVTSYLDSSTVYVFISFLHRYFGATFCSKRSHDVKNYCTFFLLAEIDFAQMTIIRNISRK